MVEKSKYSLIIGWLYPDLMSTYGDRGNIIVLQKRCEWRRIDVRLKRLDLGFMIDDLRKCNLIFMGGAQDTQQAIVSEDLKKKSATIKKMIEDGIPGLYICGAYQFLGKYYREADGTIIPGLSIFDLYTENPGLQYKRLIGNIILDVSQRKNSRGVLSSTPRAAGKAFGDARPRWISIDTLVGFENHGGRTYLGLGVEPLGIVKVGYGNNGEDKTEGALYKNAIGSYLHGPILPKNPELADWLIEKALEVKYKKSISLSPLDDNLEHKAKEVIVKRYLS